MNVKRILIVDDHPVVQFGMANVLSASFPDTTIDCASSAIEARDLLMSSRSAQPKAEYLLVFVDIKQPDADGLDLIGYVKNTFQIPVIAVSGINRSGKCHECFELGADGFIEKTAQIGIYAAAAHLVLSGAKFYPPDFFRPVSASSNSHCTSSLTTRQKEVLDLVITGKSNKTIACSMGLSEGTIKHHISALLGSYHVSSRSQLILASIKPEQTPRTNA